jgi:hypothetical protein
MSTNTENGRRRVVVAPVIGSGGIHWAWVIPIWIASAVINLALLGLAFLVFSLLDARGATDDSQVEVVTTTQVDDVQKEPDLTNTDIGIDDSVATNFNVDKIDDVSVPGMVDPTAPTGIVNAPEEAVRATVPAPPGSGGGTGLAPLLADGPGVGGMAGTLGGMGGNYFVGAFSGRSGATREKMITEGGGNQISEAAVARGLQWLALHQAQDGHWGLHDFHRHARDKAMPAGKTFTCNCDGATSRHNDVAATGFALLPFLAAGITHKPNTAANARVDYTKTVHEGLKYLMAKQNQGRDGFFGGDMYSHGIATIALCEAVGLTNDPLLKQSAQRAITYIVNAQDVSGGGWRYAPRTAGDTSVTGWELMALKSAQMSGLNVPRGCISACERFLDSVESTNKGRYSYTPGSGESMTMTAVGLLCRQYLGVNPRNPGLIAGVDYLRGLNGGVPGGSGNLYYEYYATQVMHHMGGDSWNYWNGGKDGKNGMRDELIKRQSHNSGNKQHLEGSWPPDTSPEGGRIMSTSLSLLCLEVYYRHLPLYRRDMGVMKGEK